MKIELALVINTLRSFNAPQHVIEHFTRMDTRTPETMTQAERVGKQLEQMRTKLRECANAEGYVRRADIQRKLAPCAAFRSDPQGIAEAFQATIDRLIELNEITQLSASQSMDALNTSGKVYLINRDKSSHVKLGN